MYWQHLPVAHGCGVDESENLPRPGYGDRVEVTSAGIFALSGASASEGSIQAMAERDLDLSNHRGQQLTGALIREADLILVMAEAHRRSIFYNWPQALHKTFLLSEMVGEHAEIADPYGLDQAAYDEAAAIIEDYIQRGLPELLKRLQVES